MNGMTPQVAVGDMAFPRAVLGLLGPPGMNQVRAPAQANSFYFRVNTSLYFITPQRGALRLDHSTNIYRAPPRNHTLFCSLPAPGGQIDLVPAQMGPIVSERKA